MTVEQRTRYCGPKSKTHRQALSEAAKQRYADLAERERQSIQQKERWKDPELLARHSEIVKEHWQRSPERRFHPSYANPSALGWKMIDFLVVAGFRVIVPEVQFGKHRVDALLAEEWLAFEADEAHHTKGKLARQDVKRDEYLLRKYQLPVVRLTEEDLLPWMEG